MAACTAVPRGGAPSPFEARATRVARAPQGDVAGVWQRQSFCGATALLHRRPVHCIFIVFIVSIAPGAISDYRRRRGSLALCPLRVGDGRAARRRALRMCQQPGGREGRGSAYADAAGAIDPLFFIVSAHIVATVMRCAWIAQRASPNAIPERPPPPHGRRGSWRSSRCQTARQLRTYNFAASVAAAVGRPRRPRPVHCRFVVVIVLLFVASPVPVER
jgi:hypothetical protein